MAFVVRTSTDPALMIKSIENAIWEANNKVTFYDVQTMRRLQDSSLADRRLNLILFASFASLALILAAIGIYGVVSYSTSRRTQEIGIRMALGAQRRQVMGLVVAQGMRVVLIGLGIGVAVALALTRLLASLHFGVSATDPWTFAAVTSMLAVVASLACYIPARRATRVDPIIALRHE